MKRYSRRGAALALYVLVLVPARPALAQETPPKQDTTVKADDKPIPTVEVKASAGDYDPRRDDTASKTVINQEELMKYGDTNIYDILKRAPGVTVTGNTIRMRGLGAGYTQILVNGERAPPGFSLDDLPPDQIEKIEIIRAATAEFSMQAIAGTINIVLKKVVAKAQHDLRLNTVNGADSHSGTVSGTLADKTGNLSYYLSGTLTRRFGETDSTGGDRFTAPDGEVTQLRTGAWRVENGSTSLFLAPRLNWKLANDDQLNVGGFVQAVRSDNTSAGAYVDAVGSFGAPDYANRVYQADSAVHGAGLDVNWVAKIAGGKLDAKASAYAGAAAYGGVERYATADQATGLLRDTDNHSRYATYTSTGKYALALSADHNLAAGWNVSDRTVDQHAVRVDHYTGIAAATTDETFPLKTVQVAAYAQDEWSITRLWSLYLGARWETIRTDNGGTGLPDTQSRSHVLTPVAQTLYKFPDKSGRQLRAALTRTYKAPDASQLSGRRYVAPLNTRFTPDGSGNPDLQPELATGVDLTYEHFWAPGALFSAGTSLRRITGYIRTTLAQDTNGLWLSQPRNDGDAQVRTLDLELKFPLTLAWKAAPAIDVRASVNRNWSRVDAVPGPDNRLDNQVPLTATAGLDYKVDKLTTGASFAYRGGGAVQVSAQQSAQQFRHRDLDAYALYKFSPRYQMRVAGTYLLADPYLTLSRYRDDTGVSETWGRVPGARRVQVSLEIKL